MELLLEICVILLIVYIFRFRFSRQRNKDLEFEIVKKEDQIKKLQQNLLDLQHTLSEKNVFLTDQKNAISDQKEIIEKLNLRLRLILNYAEDGLTQFSAEELSHIPKRVVFDDYLYPHLYSDPQVERDFVVYVSRRGKYYHRKLGCRNAYDAIHLYKGIQHYLPCPHCVEPFVSNYKIPSWYYTYLLWKHLEKLPKDPEILAPAIRCESITLPAESHSVKSEDSNIVQAVSHLPPKSSETYIVEEKSSSKGHMIFRTLFILVILAFLFFVDPFNFENSSNDSSNDYTQAQSILKYTTTHTATKDEPSKSNSITVYITETGSKYHRSNCGSLRNSKIPISLDKALKSYAPCQLCNPPTR